jgi:hypothetical protein
VKSNTWVVQEQCFEESIWPYEGRSSWIQVHNDQINNTGTSNVIRVVSCAGQAARMGDGRMRTKFWLVARSWRNRLEYIENIVILK